MNNNYEEGMHFDIPEHKYHAENGLGSSSMKLCCESPAAFLNDKIGKESDETTASMEFGTAFHLKILEPKRYEELVYELDYDVSFATKEGKALRALRTVGGEEFIFLKKKAVAKLNAMASGISVVESMLQTENGSLWHEKSANEVSFFWKEECGIIGKARIDKMFLQRKWLCDIKTTQNDLSERKILTHAFDQGWALQAAWYIRGVEKVNPELKGQLTFFFVVFQSVAPFSVRIMPVPQETLDAANKIIEQGMLNYHEAIASKIDGSRPRDPFTGILDLNYKDWMLK